MKAIRIQFSNQGRGRLCSVVQADVVYSACTGLVDISRGEYQNFGTEHFLPILTVSCSTIVAWLTRKGMPLTSLQKAQSR